MFENTYVATSGSGNISDQQFVGEVFIACSEVHPAFDTYNVIFLNDDLHNYRDTNFAADQGNTDAQRVAVAELEKRLEKIKADIDGCVENMARSTSESAQRRLERKLETWEADQGEVEAELAKLKVDTPPETSVSELL